MGFYTQDMYRILYVGENCDNKLNHICVVKLDFFFFLTIFARF